MTKKRKIAAIAAITTVLAVSISMAACILIPEPEAVAGRWYINGVLVNDTLDTTFIFPNNTNPGPLTLINQSATFGGASMWAQHMILTATFVNGIITAAEFTSHNPGGGGTGTGLEQNCGYTIGGVASSIGGFFDVASGRVRAGLLNDRMAVIDGVTGATTTQNKMYRTMEQFVTYHDLTFVPTE